MRNILLVLAMLTAATSSVMAQSLASDSKNDTNTSVKHETYITNDWFDNWYIGIGGGATTSFSQISNARVTPEFDVNVLKWFAPQVGVRLGYSGQWGKEYITTEYNPYQINHTPLPFDGKIGGPGTLSYNMFYLHGDLMWNISNTFWGYKRDRIYNISPYANCGWLHLYNPGEKRAFDNEIGFGLGLYNTFRLADRWMLTLDLRHTNVASRYKTKDGVRTNFLALSVGCAYNIFRTYWTRTSSLTTEISSAKQDAEELRKALLEKDKEVAMLNDKLEKATAVTVIKQEVVNKIVDQSRQNLFFAIGSAKLAKCEKMHLDEFVRLHLSEGKNPVFCLTGSADEITGNKEFNEKLSTDRAIFVKKLLVEQYGINPDNIQVKNIVALGSTDEAPYLRCVRIEVQ